MSQHLVYICADASSTNTVTKEFKMKSLQNMTIGRLSQIHVLAKPTEPQFAYGGYKTAIEAFVAATIMKKKLLTSAEEYKLPADFIPSVPLPLPQLMQIQIHTSGDTGQDRASWGDQRKQVLWSRQGKDLEGLVTQSRPVSLQLKRPWRRRTRERHERLVMMMGQ